PGIAARMDPRCGIRHEPSNGYTLVDITVDGPLDKFMNRTGSLELKSQSFFLLDGSGKTATFEAAAKTYDHLFGVGGFATQTEDQLYGASIQVTTTEHNTDGSERIDHFSYYVDRWVDVIDAFEAEFKMGTTAAFYRTLTGGLFIRTKKVHVQLPDQVDTSFVRKDAGFPFDLGGPVRGDMVATWHFTPVAPGKLAEDFDITVQDRGAGPVAVGTITAKGTATDPSVIDLNLDGPAAQHGFKQELKRVIMSLTQAPGRPIQYTFSDGVAEDVSAN